jgi:geranylgeranyl reductase family protein
VDLGSVTCFDVIVVGAGPGGSNAASVCLDAGLTVLQIDAQPFPRTKPCAGGVTPKSLSALRGELGDQLRGTVTRIEFASANGGGSSFEPKLPLLRFVHRPDFDAELVRRNLPRSGFRFLDAEKVEAVDWDGVFRVESCNGTYRARQLIGADGSTGIVNRVFRVAAPRGRATAVETEIVRPHGSRPIADACFDFGAIDQGYGWVFPKDDYWSVGLYTIGERAPGLREKLRRYIADKGLADFSGGKVVGHRYGVGGYRLTPPECPLYVVGDAGGFAEAITGEGIYSALRSGAIAGETAARVHGGRSQPAEYYRRLWRDVLWDTRISWHAARYFYRDPGRWIGLLRNPLVWRPLVEGYTEGATLSGCLFWGGLFLLRSRGARRRRVARS